MELYQTHIAFLNAMLLPKYKLDPVAKSDSRQVTPRLETFLSRESIFSHQISTKIPEKRLALEKKLPVDEEYNPGTKKTKNSEN